MEWEGTGGGGKHAGGCWRRGVAAGGDVRVCTSQSTGPDVMARCRHAAPHPVPHGKLSRVVLPGWHYVNKPSPAPT